MSMALARRGFLAASLLVAARVAAAGQPPLRIGYQKIGSFVILKQRQTLEASGLNVDWVQFQAGPPLMEALNAGAIDVGFAGDTPPVFAQAAGVDLAYIAFQSMPGESSAILVHANSPLKTTADLRGQRVAFTKGSSAHYLVVRALRQAGLGMNDITPVYLQPADAGAAFRSGSVDAWAIWDPFYAIAQRDPAARVLASGTIAPSNSFYLARKTFAQANPAMIASLIHEINAAAVWSEQHQDELARIMSDVTGVDLEAQRAAAARSTFRVDTMTDAVIATQQGLADTFTDLRIIPRRIDVRAAVWLPGNKLAFNGAVP